MRHSRMHMIDQSKIVDVCASFIVERCACDTYFVMCDVALFDTCDMCLIMLSRVRTSRITTTNNDRHMSFVSRVVDATRSRIRDRVRASFVNNSIARCVNTYVDASFDCDRMKRIARNDLTHLCDNVRVSTSFNIITHTSSS